MKKVVYTVHLPFEREGRPVGARFETEDDFYPTMDMTVTPAEDVTLYVEGCSYNPANKTVYIELSFISPYGEIEDEEGMDEDDIDLKSMALCEVGLETLVGAGWLPLHKGEMGEQPDPELKIKEPVH